MKISVRKEIESIYPACCFFLGPRAWRRFIELCNDKLSAETFPENVDKMQCEHPIPDFLPELARLEWTKHQVSMGEVTLPDEVKKIEINPSLVVLHLTWLLTSVLNSKNSTQQLPRPGEEWALVWRDPKTDKTNVEAATDEELLALKMAAEDVRPEKVASLGNISVGQLEGILYDAAEKSLLLLPASRIKRDFIDFPFTSDTFDGFMSASVFTLQWHITNACDLHCKHCYDRNTLSPLTLKQGLRILDDLGDFCRSRNVRGHVCFTGGNPFFYPHFFDLYSAAKDHGFSTSILGNPIPRTKIEDLIAIQYPTYFQVSLEGLPEHNDWIRGQGNFTKVIEFLGVLRDFDISSAVMLTLTKDNMDQILPLAERLRGHTDHFTFNRLSQVGEGAKLQLPAREDYVHFLQEYVDAGQHNPIIGIKDNLINIVHHQKGMGLFGGCTGFGCGAGFSFIAVLPNGEAHACRKFPSPIGNLMKQCIAEIYDSETAQRYRAGSRACCNCTLKSVCGGCLAVAYSSGLDIFEDRDPFCFIDEL